jgi:KDO2-lipid IV(A) lauroyltransferase
MLLLGWVVSRMPLRSIFQLGAVLGTLYLFFGSGRRRIARRNIELCFSDLSSEEQSKLLRENFKESGIGLLESLIPWLNPDRDLKKHFEIIGLDHLKSALSKNKGVILIGAHFTSIDICCQPLSELESVAVIYRKNKNPVWENLQTQGRLNFFDHVIDRGDMRKTLKHLRSGKIIWYAPDQDYGIKHSVFAPFFGVQAATITATERIASSNSSPVLFFSVKRDNKRCKWSLLFEKEIKNFPAESSFESARILNNALEKIIRECPEQYLWMHRRFKTRPPGEVSLY